MRRLFVVPITLWLAVGGASPTPVLAQAKLSTTNTKARNLWEKAQDQAKSRDFNKAIETLAQLTE